MATNDLVQLLLAGTAPRNLRSVASRGLAPLAPHQTLRVLVLLLEDSDPEIADQAAHTLSSWDRDELALQLKSPDCPDSVLSHFSTAASTEAMQQAIAANPSTPGEAIEALASFVPAHLLEIILDNRVRIIERPSIIENIRKNPSITLGIRRQIQEIEIEFLGGKKKEYAVETATLEAADREVPDAGEFADLEVETLLDDFSLERLPVDGEERQAELSKRLSTLTVRQKIQQALFGNREIRAVLVRDTNKEVARSVLRSPKLTDNEVESIAAMRGVAEDILRDIGNSREWAKSYTVIQNLVKNPKTPPAISQRLLFRLQTRDLMMLTRDRSVPDAVRHNAQRAFNQRNASRPTK